MCINLVLYLASININLESDRVLAAFLLPKRFVSYGQVLLRPKKKGVLYRKISFQSPQYMQYIRSTTGIVWILHDLHLCYQTILIEAGHGCSCESAEDNLTCQTVAVPRCEK